MKLNFAMKSWDGLGMPQQPSTGDGSSSCGIEVISSVNDIISGSGNVQYSWSFNENSGLRKIRMNELLELREGLEKVPSKTCIEY